MSWIQKLYETYENCQSEIGVTSKDKKSVLMPVSHIFQQVQIEITLDQNGVLKGIKPVSKEDAGTIIPCTEESAGRAGSDPKSHPLCDKLQYVAKDFWEYVEGATPEYRKKQAKMHQQYFKLLTSWCSSEFSHPKIKSILNYVEQGTVTKDLLDYGVIKLESNGKLKTKAANQVVRWIVYSSYDLQEKTWCDESMYKSWIQFDMGLSKPKSLCYVTGEVIRLASNHPKYIRIPGDSAKLISSNDTSGFTFLGRFLQPEQAYGLGYEVTQKAHNALRWLIGKQGRIFFEGKQREPGLTIVAWATSGKEIPDLLADPFSILGYESLKSDSDSVVYTAQELVMKLNKKIAGYNVELGDTSDIVVMGLDSATPGRMAITFYRELTGSDFLNRIENWHQSCCWIHDFPKEIEDPQTGEKRKVRVKFVGAPSPSDIAESAYGRKVDDKLRKVTVERILPCIIDGQRLPRDIVEATVRRVSNRLGMDDWEWNKSLSIACALYKKYQKDYYKEELSMALDEKRKTRDYLYGRLLALADSLEEWALKVAGENRQTNAARLMQRFAEHPYSTWRTLELALGPYKARLAGKGFKRQQIISDVMNMFEVEDFINDKRLNGEFLLGYHCQREALWKKDEEKN
jgi:CRISPR-associated protein Csd1